jgi:regulatory protein
MLKKYGYINDEGYAVSYTNDSFKFKGWGSRKIKAELIHKGVSEETVSRVLEDAELDEETKAYELLKKRLKGNNNPDYKERAKHYRYLVGRGFSFDDINTAFSRLVQEDDDWS